MKLSLFCYCVSAFQLFVLVGLRTDENKHDLSIFGAITWIATPAIKVC